MATRIEGLEGMKAIIVRAAKNLPQRAGAALYAEANVIMGVSKARCPVDTGVLRGSAFTEEPEFHYNGTISDTMGYGGAASAYAHVVHENLEARHNSPTTAKYLENPLKEAAPTLAERIGRRIDLSTL